MANSTGRARYKWTPKDQRLAIAISGEMKKQLAELADQRETSMAALLRRMVRTELGRTP
jgi:hypothetical protein